MHDGHQARPLPAPKKWALSPGACFGPLLGTKTKGEKQNPNPGLEQGRVVVNWARVSGPKKAETKRNRRCVPFRFRDFPARLSGHTSCPVFRARNRGSRKAIFSCSCFRKSYVEGVISLLEWTVLEWSWMTGGVNFNAPR